MVFAQANLGTWTDEEPEGEPDEGNHQEGGPPGAALPDAYEGRELAPDDPLSCPWCLAPPEEFRDSYDGQDTACGVCEALIPVGAEWYERGEKIVEVWWAAQMH